MFCYAEGKCFVLFCFCSQNKLVFECMHNGEKYLTHLSLLAARSICLYCRCVCRETPAGRSLCGETIIVIILWESCPLEKDALHPDILAPIPGSLNNLGGLTITSNAIDSINIQVYFLQDL